MLTEYDLVDATGAGICRRASEVRPEGCYLGVGHGGLALCCSGGHLVVTAAVGTERILECLVQVIRAEGHTILRRLAARQFIVADGNGGAWVRSEGDHLWAFQFANRRIRDSRFEVAAKVELVVCLTREAYDIRSCSLAVAIVRIVMSLTIVFLIEVAVAVLPLILRVIVIPEEGVRVMLWITAGNGCGIVKHRLIDIAFDRSSGSEFPQPVLMALLRTLVALGAATIEVGDLTLILRGDQFGGER